MPVLTNNFRKSKWADQEAGMAHILKKTVVPLKIHVNPYGFISPYQAFSFNLKTVTISCKRLVLSLAKRPKIGNKIRDLLICKFGNSSSYDEAAINTMTLLRLNKYSKRQINQIIKFALENRQIYASRRALPRVHDFFRQHKKLVENRLAKKFRALAYPVKHMIKKTESKQTKIPKGTKQSKKPKTRLRKWDFFICHASEDKNAVAIPIHDRLVKKGYKVWLDQYTLKLGDRLRRKIEEGLRNSRYGVVILSPDFFAKKWPQDELDGLFALEQDGKKRILPIWHNVDFEDVKKYSPILAGRLAAKTSEGIVTVVNKIIEASID